MATQAKIGAAVAGAAMAAWMFVVHRERGKTPQGRRRLFTPGSADDLQSGNLQEGDLVLFERNCALYFPGGAAVCAATKALTACPYDHAGVIVRDRGVPLVAEATFSGVHMRPFEERVQCSRSLKVVVRQLEQPLTADERFALREEAAKAVRESSKLNGPETLTSWAAAATTRGPSAAALSQPAALARRLYAATGRLSHTSASPSASSGSEDVTLPACAPSHTAGAGALARFGALTFRSTQWYRDRTVS